MFNTFPIFGNMKPTATKILFHYLVPQFHFTNRTHLKSFILELFKREGRAVEHINYIFCTDNYLLKVNKEHLGHNTYTDIITFDLSSPDSDLVSDIYISAERVKENALFYKTPFSTELRRVMFHGALHLCGYTDKSSSNEALMRDKEELYLSLYNVSRETNLKK